MISELPTCADVVELVTEYLEGGLSTDDRLAFERHVNMCPPCRGYLAQFRRTLDVAGSLREEDVREPLRDELVRAFRNWRSGPT